jgi:hypothetical protein
LPSIVEFQSVPVIQTEIKSHGMSSFFSAEYIGGI